VRALLVAAAPTAGSIDLVARLAETADLVIAIDGGGAVCLDADVRPDVVLGDFDSLAPSALNRLTAGGARVVTFPARKDRTDLELAIDEARSAGATEVVLTCAATGRLDHTLAALGALEAAADLHPELAEPDVSAWVLAPEGRSELVLFGVGATISLLASTMGAVVTESGVEWPLEAHDLLPGSGLGVSNVIASAEGARVLMHEGTVLVLAPALPSAPRASRR
jgi:thiamine pyrophosphokinase